MKKYIIFLIVLSVIFISMVNCQPDKPKSTTYAVRNEVGGTLYEVASFYWDGEDILDFIEHGDLEHNKQTSGRGTSRSELYLAFIYPQNGTFFMTAYPYEITKDDNNVLLVNGETWVVYGATPPSSKLIMNDVVYSVEDITDSGALSSKSLVNNDSETTKILEQLKEYMY